jgi:hypothetical protein
LTIPLCTNQTILLSNPSRTSTYTARRPSLLQILTESATPVSIEDRGQLIKAANTSLSSKIVGQNSGLLSPMAVDCLLKILDPERPDLLDLKDVKVGTGSVTTAATALLPVLLRVAMLRCQLGHGPAWRRCASDWTTDWVSVCI